MSRSPHPGETHPPVPPDTPIFDAFAYLAFLAGQTERVRLGTHVYNIGLRHPFIAARAVQTLDIVSGGRVEFGIGASWLEEEWVAAELDFATRGRRGRRGDRGLQAALDRGRGRRTTASSSTFEGAVFVPKCVQTAVARRSSSAARAAPRCGAPRVPATAGSG